MASFAKLNENNIVERGSSVVNDVITDDNNIEQEALGIQFLKSVHGQDTNWKQTSYNTLNGIHFSLDENGNKIESEDQTKAFRKNHAAIGYTYDENRDAFIPPKPHASWILNEETCRWEAPTPSPETPGTTYIWNEDNLDWELYEPTV